MIYSSHYMKLIVISYNKKKQKALLLKLQLQVTKCNNCSDWHYQ